MGISKRRNLLRDSLCLVLSSICIAIALPAFASGFATSGQFDQVTTFEMPRMTLRIVQSISFKNGSIRIDTDDPAQMVPMTNIETPDEVYLYCPLMTTGEKQPITTKLPDLLDRMVEQTKATLASATKTGTDTCDGYACDTYGLTDNNGTENIKFWVSTDPNFPFTIKTIVTDTTVQKTTTIELQNINLNGSVDDSLFDIPSGIKFTVPPPPTPPAATSTKKVTKSTS